VFLHLARNFKKLSRKSVFAQLPAMKPSMSLVLSMLFLSLKDSASTLDNIQVDSSIRIALNTILDSEDPAETELKFKAVQDELAGTFEALPKNLHGRLAPRAVQYMVATYFTREHALHIEGLEHQGMQQAPGSALHEVPILQEKSPDFAQVLADARLSESGLSLEELVTVIIVLEHFLIMDQKSLLDISYRVWNVSTHDDLNETTIKSLLAYCMLTLWNGDYQKSAVATLVTAAGQEPDSRTKDVNDFIQELFDKPAYLNRDRMNPFVPRKFSREDASRLLRQVSSSFGKWQDASCQNMKKSLTTLDPHGSGRVPLATLYNAEGATDFFSESKAYLEQIGALDKSQPGRPEVIFTNYIQGPSNCIEPWPHYSICCLRECEPLMTQIENHIRASVAEPEKLLNIVRNLSTPSSDAPRRLQKRLVSKLWSIAERHGGRVPLHGRLFAQWMHYAFPWECPYPSVVASPKALKARSWPGKTAEASASDVQRYRQQAKIRGGSEAAVPTMMQWTEEEILLMSEYEEEALGRAADFSKVRAFCRIVAQVAASFAMLAGVLAGWRTLRQAQQLSAEEDTRKPSRKQKRRIRGELERFRKRSGNSRQHWSEASPDELEEFAGEDEAPEDSWPEANGGSSNEVSEKVDGSEEGVSSVQVEVAATRSPARRRKKASAKRSAATLQAESQDADIPAPPTAQPATDLEAEPSGAAAEPEAVSEAHPVDNSEADPESQPEAKDKIAVAHPVNNSDSDPESQPEAEVAAPVNNSDSDPESQPEVEDKFAEAAPVNNSDSEPELQPEAEPEMEQRLNMHVGTEASACAKVTTAQSAAAILPDSTNVAKKPGEESLLFKGATEQPAQLEIKCSSFEFPCLHEAQPAQAAEPPTSEVSAHDGLHMASGGRASMGKYLLPPAPSSLPPPLPPPGLEAPQRPPPPPPPGLELMLIPPPPGLSLVAATEGLPFRPPPGLEDVHAVLPGNSPAASQAEKAVMQDVSAVVAKCHNRWSRRSQKENVPCPSKFQ